MNAHQNEYRVVGYIVVYDENGNEDIQETRKITEYVWAEDEDSAVDKVYDLHGPIEITSVEVC